MTVVTRPENRASDSDHRASALDSAFNIAAHSHGKRVKTETGRIGFIKELLHGAERHLLLLGILFRSRNHHKTAKLQVRQRRDIARELQCLFRLHTALRFLSIHVHFDQNVKRRHSLGTLG